MAVDHHAARMEHCIEKLIPQILSERSKLTVMAFILRVLIFTIGWKNLLLQYGIFMIVRPDAKHTQIPLLALIGLYHPNIANACVINTDQSSLRSLKYAYKTVLQNRTKTIKHLSCFDVFEQCGFTDHSSRSVASGRTRSSCKTRLRSLRVRIDDV